MFFLPSPYLVLGYFSNTEGGLYCYMLSIQHLLDLLNMNGLNIIYTITELFLELIRYFSSYITIIMLFSCFIKNSYV